jgi:anti-sigma factor RsiW
MTDQRDLISAWLDGELDPVAAATVEARVATDIAWREELVAARDARARVRSLTEREPPSGFIDSLLLVGHADANRRTLVVRRSRRVGAGLAAAAAITVAFLVPEASEPPPVRPAIGENADDHAVNAALADDPVSQLAPVAGATP